MDRVNIGCNYTKQPFWKVVVGVPLIYLPIITTVPFVIVGIILVKTHLKYVGGMNIKSYWEFVPDWITHRYTQENQITLEELPAFHFARHKYFWIFNCKMYCPLSVALFKYMSYLVQIVENWWCPFNHGKKNEYTEGAIDKSFWHVDPVDTAKLHPEDRDNPIWNEDVKK